MKKRVGVIWIVTGIVLALGAGALAFWVVVRESAKVAPAVEPVPKAKVVVAARSFAIRELIQEGDVVVRTVPVEIIPDTAARAVAEVVDRLAVVPISPGEIILVTDVLSPTLKGAHLALIMEETQVAMAFPAGDLMSRNNLLQPGDHVDVLYSIDALTSEEGEEKVTFTALQNVEIASVILPTGPEATAGSSPPLAIIFTLDPQDALVLKHLRDRAGVVDIVLRAPEAKELFETQPVNMDYLVNRYQLRIPVFP